MSTTEKAIHVLISGVVQGVFYRKSTLQKATELELRGWVRNLEDGRVECTACGSEEMLLKFLSWLGKGPIKAKVERVDVDWFSTEDPVLGHISSGFVIEKTGSM